MYSWRQRQDASISYILHCVLHRVYTMAGWKTEGNTICGPNSATQVNYISVTFACLIIVVSQRKPTKNVM